MKVPRLRLRLADCMVLVALVAVDAAAIRAYADHFLLAFVWQFDLFAPQHEAASLLFVDELPVGQTLIVGVFPMLNALAVALLLALRRPQSRPFWLGFAASGTAALALFVTLTACFRDEVVVPYLGVFARPNWAVISQHWPDVVPTDVRAAAVLGLPQLAIALIGGFVVAAARRGGRPPSPDA